MPGWISLCVISLLLSLTAALLWYVFKSGLLAEIVIRTGSPPIRKITFAYKFKQGPHKILGQLFREASTLGPELPCIGVYYDDPNKGQPCRFAAGSILSEGENKPDEDLLNIYKSAGFNVFSFPEATHAVTTSFPYRTFLSIILRLRVYVPLLLYIKEKRLCAHPFLEIYREGRIHFIAPLAQQEYFYVPEALPEKRQPEQEETHSDSDVSGAESNSEYSSGSGVLLSDSRETSLAASSVRSVPLQDHEERDGRGRSSGGISLKELDWEQAGGQQAEREELLHGDSNQKSLEAPTQEWWGVVGEEE